MWDSVVSNFMGTVCQSLLPTKTSQFLIHPLGRPECFLKMSSQVAPTSWVQGWSHLITVAVILLSVSCLFMTLYHYILTSSSVWVVLCLTLSHWSTQTRCMASETIIWSSLDAPLTFVLFPLVPCWGLVWFLVGPVAVRQPHPMIDPRFMSGHWSASYGHSSFVWSHTCAVWPALHVVNTCSMSSVVLHGVQ